MRKLISYLVFSAMFWQICILPGTQLLSLNAHRNKREERIRDAARFPQAVTVFYFGKYTELLSLNWLDKDEFIHQGKMYDLVKIENSSGKFILWALDDAKEKELREAVAGQSEEHHRPGKTAVIKINPVLAHRVEHHDPETQFPGQISRLNILPVSFSSLPSPLPVGQPPESV